MKNKIIFRLYQIDKSLDDIEKYLNLETDEDIDPRIYRLVWDNVEDTDLDALHRKYTSDGRPNSYVARALDVSDVVEIEKPRASVFYILDNFGWTQISEFDKTLVPKEMGFEKGYVNTDVDSKKVLNIEMKGRAVIEIMVQRLKKSKKAVAKMFYSSETSEELSDKVTGLWRKSPYFIAEAWEKELKEDKDTKGE